MPNYEITFNNGDARLLIKDVTPDDSSTYTCSAVNPLGSEAMSAELIVKGIEISSTVFMELLEIFGLTFFLEFSNN